MKLNTNQIRHCMYISYRSNAIEHMTDLENVEHFAFDDVNGMIGIKNNILYIIFSGSDEPTNWINDFKFWKRPYRKIIPYSGVNPKIRVHHGFITSYKKSRNFVLNKAKDYEKVICTGHSLGGVLSQFAALDIQYNLGDKVDVTCVAFANPRPGNCAFAKSFNNRVIDCYRFRNGDDIVTKLPPFIFFYKHVGKFFQLGKTKSWKIFGSFVDHFESKYLISLKKFEL